MTTFALSFVPLVQLWHHGQEQPDKNQRVNSYLESLFLYRTCDSVSLGLCVWPARIRSPRMLPCWLVATPVAGHFGLHLACLFHFLSWSNYIYIIIFLFFIFNDSFVFTRWKNVTLCYTEKKKWKTYTPRKCWMLLWIIILLILNHEVLCKCLHNRKM